MILVKREVEMINNVYRNLKEIFIFNNMINLIFFYHKSLYMENKMISD